MGKKKQEQNAPQGAPLWMVTFGDLMSLLLTFFVLILSFSTIQEAGFKTAMGSLQGALGILRLNKESFLMDRLVHPDAVFAFIANQMRQTTGDITDDLNFISEITGAKIEYEEYGARIILPAGAVFKPGGVELTNRVRPIMRKLGAYIFENKVDVSVEGHSDSQEVSDIYKTRWELSAARALNVLEHFHDCCNIPYDKMTMSGFGEYRPRASNETSMGRAENRRVEVLIKTQKDKVTTRR